MGHVGEQKRGPGGGAARVGTVGGTVCRIPAPQARHRRYSPIVSDGWSVGWLLAKDLAQARRATAGISSFTQQRRGKLSHD